MGKNTTGSDTGKAFLPLYRERSAPYKAFLFYAIVGSGLLFIALSIMFIVWVSQQQQSPQIIFPKSFILSTLVLLFSGYMLSVAERFHQKDHAQNLLLSLNASLFMAVAFVVLQAHAILSIIQQGFYAQLDISLIFLYIITGFHFLHIAAGIIYLFYLNLKAFDIWRDPVKSLIYFSNKFEGLRLELFSSFWYYATGLWLFLFLVFLYSL